jgi:superfamily II DNA/RNA helicase
MPTFNPSQFINKNPSEIAGEVYKPKHTFGDFGFDEKMVQTLINLGLVTPTPIQDQIIPEILNGKDVVGLAETGTGKTAAFLLPLIEKTLHDSKQQTLIMAPTRELAIQINDELRTMVKDFRIFSTVCVGGMGIRQQLASLRRTNHFVIGTPGRILDHIERGSIRPGEMHNVVLDEADRMLDMGFINDMKKILSAMPKDRHTLFFSATMNNTAKQVVEEFLKAPVTISVKKKDIAASIAQDVVPFNGENKFFKLSSMLVNSEFKRVIIFGEMKHSVQKLSDQLSKEGIPSESIHGNKSHGQRQRALKAFKEGRARVLVATDVAARGIHVDDVSHVINYDLPQTFEDYTHRIGRTGRGDKTGQALTFVPTK